MQQKVPFSLIRCSSSKVAFCSCMEWGWHIYNIVESESDPLTRRAIDLFEKEPLKGNSEVHLHTPTKFGEDRSKDLGGDREQTDRQTNRQTDKRCSIYSMIYTNTKYIHLRLKYVVKITWRNAIDGGKIATITRNAILYMMINAYRFVLIIPCAHTAMKAIRRYG